SKSSASSLKPPTITDGFCTVCLPVSYRFLTLFPLTPVAPTSPQEPSSRRDPRLDRISAPWLLVITARRDGISELNPITTDAEGVLNAPVDPVPKVKDLEEAGVGQLHGGFT